MSALVKELEPYWQSAVSARAEVDRLEKREQEYGRQLLMLEAHHEDIGNRLPMAYQALKQAQKAFCEKYAELMRAENGD